MRAELMTGPVRRRRWSEEDKIRILKEAFAPGAVVSDVARRNDVRPPQIYQWRRELVAASRPEASDARFVQLAPLPCGASSGSVQNQGWSGTCGQVEVVLVGGRVLRLRADVPCDELRRLIRAVESA